jgi:hypothetical protein
MSDPRLSRPSVQAEPKARGANRSTKVAGKLKVLPEQPDNLPSFRSEGVTLRTPPSKVDSVEVTGDSDEADIDEDEDEQEDEIEVSIILLSASFFSDFLATQVYNQISLIPEGTARRDALRLTKKKAKSLPRVTAYATAGYLLPPLVGVR